MPSRFGDEPGFTGRTDTQTSSDANSTRAPTFDNNGTGKGAVSAPGKKDGVNQGDFYEKPNYGPGHNTDTTLLQNPLAGMTRDDVLNDVDHFVDSHGLAEHRDVFRKGALLARYNQDPYGFERVPDLTDAERDMLRFEIEHKWHQPFQLYFLVVLCAGSAIVQGMDQTAVNGAQQFYFDEFGIGEDQVYIRGLLNGAPYLCSALIGCWLK
jgi:hypothetical protein